jgi:ATP-binding cassette subfamily B protein
VSDPYVEDPDPHAERGDRRRLAVLWRLLPLMRPHKGRFLLALATLLAGSGITLVYPWAARAAVDVGMSGQTTGDLDRIVVILVCVFMVNAVLVWLRHYSVSWLGERIVTDLRGLVFDRILTLPLGWFTSAGVVSSSGGSLRMSPSSRVSSGASCRWPCATACRWSGR